MTLRLLEGGIFRGVKRYTELTKFKLSVLNGLVAAASFSLCPSTVPVMPLFASSIALSMSTQALNQYIEVELDRKMLRTSQRPLVLGVDRRVALWNGLGLGVVGLGGLMTYGVPTALLGATIWSGYLLVYTKMKGTSHWNTMVGSVVGSLPVYLGWMAAGGNFCMMEPFALFLYMMAWQHQHFYGIRWIYYDDYQKAGFKMQKDKSIAAGHVIFQTILTLVFSNYSLKYFHVPHCLLLNIPLTAGLYWWGIRSSFQFAGGKITPKQFKMNSYKHFLLVFSIFFLCKLLGNTNKQTMNRKQRNKVSFDDDNGVIFDSVK